MTPKDLLERLQQRRPLLAAALITSHTRMLAPPRSQKSANRCRERAGPWGFAGGGDEGAVPACGTDRRQARGSLLGSRKSLPRCAIGWRIVFPRLPCQLPPGIH